MPRLGDTQVNATKYNTIVIEQFGFYQNDEPQWAVPAWEERSLAELAGPFSTIDEAEKALRDCFNVI